MPAASWQLTLDGGLFIKTWALLYRDRSGKVWKLRVLRDEKWEVTEIWKRFEYGDIAPSEAGAPPQGPTAGPPEGPTIPTV